MRRIARSIVLLVAVAGLGVGWVDWEPSGSYGGGPAHGIVHNSPWG